MSSVGQIERKTQQRVVKLYQQQLGYSYPILDPWLLAHTRAQAGE